MINTYNETQLHKTLKNLYCDTDGQTEAPYKGYICDIITHTGAIVEIHTKNFYSIRQKLERLLLHTCITIIHPIIQNNNILLLNADGSKRSFRKSPKHENFFCLFKELYSIAHLINHKHLTFFILYIDCLTIKIDDKQAKTRFKNPRIIEKFLLSINSEKTITNIDEFCKPVLYKLPHTFTVQDIKKLKAQKYSPFIISFLKKHKKIVLIEKKGRQHIYEKTGV